MGRPEIRPIPAADLRKSKEATEAGAQEGRSAHFQQMGFYKSAFPQRELRNPQGTSARRKEVIWLLFPLDHSRCSVENRVRGMRQERNTA